jgi:hypothetical protein
MLIQSNSRNEEKIWVFAESDVVACSTQFTRVRRNGKRVFNPFLPPESSAGICSD